MNVYLARQPIFNKNGKLYGYELLYRSGGSNSFSCEDGDKASSDVIINSFLLFGIENITAGKKAFINFTDHLLKEGMATLFPKKDIVIEILETVEPCDKITKSCADLKNKGYTIALDDFVFREEYLPLISLADIIKVDFLATPPEICENVVKTLNKRSIRFLAEKIETHDDFEKAKAWGYSLFQGYFFSKPVIMATGDIPPLKLNYLRLIQKTSAAELDFDEITNIISRDLSLSYKLLRLVNSAAFGFRFRVKSVKQALAILGSEEIRKWVSLIAIRGIGDGHADEVVTTSLVRARFLERLSMTYDHAAHHDNCFLTGLFSELDVLMNRPISEILKEVAVADEVVDALIHNGGRMGLAYRLILAYEKADWDAVSDLCGRLGFDGGVVTEIYLEALGWCRQLETENDLQI